MNTAQTIGLLLRTLASHGTAVDRAKRLASFPGAGFKQMETFLATHSTLGAQFAERVGFDALVSLAIGQAYEQWDGKGQPLHLRGDQICFPARVVQFAGPAETFHRRHGLHAAVAMGHRGRGRRFAPEVVDTFGAHAAEILDDMSEAGSWAALLAAEPGLVRRDVQATGLDAVLVAIADMIDLKSPYLAGHSRGVANLAAEAGRTAGSPTRRCRRCAGLGCYMTWPTRRVVGHLGQAWPAHRDRVRTGPAPSVSHRSDTGANPGAEPDPGDRGAPPRAAGRLGLSARAHRRVAHPARPSARRGRRLSRAYRAAPAPPSARRRPCRHGELRDPVRRGLLDREAANAVLRAAGHRAPPRGGLAGRPHRPRGGGAAVARPRSSERQIAQRLVVSPKTVSNHVEHIYAKLHVQPRRGDTIRDPARPDRGPTSGGLTPMCWTPGNCSV